MDSYFEQMAQQALAGLVEEGSLEERLKTACFHLRQVTNEHYLPLAPTEVRDCLLALQKAENTANASIIAQEVCTTIELIFRTGGCADGFSKFISQ